MTRLNVNPTRIQLKTLKARLATATRGHKLLKDKLDEMIRNYSILIKKNYAIRKEYEDEIREVLKNFTLAKCYMSRNEVVTMFSIFSGNAELDIKSKSIMNVQVPDISLKQDDKFVLPYSLFDTNALMDKLTYQMNKVMPKLIELSSIEKTCQILSTQIEQTKRQVNSLENLTIPQLEETIKYIVMKIEENDRSSKIRQLKVKSLTTYKE